MAEHVWEGFWQVVVDDTDAEIIPSAFRSASAFGGRCAWRETADGWAAEHEIAMSAHPGLAGAMSAHPGLAGARLLHTARFEDDRAEVELAREDASRCARSGAG